MALFGLFNPRKTNASGEMSFWGHIDALRGHLFRSALVVIVLAVVLFCYPEFLFDKVIFGPLQNFLRSIESTAMATVLTWK